MIETEKKELAIRLRRSGLTYKEIAREIGTSTTWVRGICVKENLGGWLGSALKREEYIAYKAEGHTNKEVAARFGIGNSTATRLCNGVSPQRAKTKTDEEAKTYVEQFLPSDYSYVGGYVDCEHKVTIRCNKCGDVFDRSMVSIRHGDKTTCRNCAKIKREQRETEKKIEKANKEKLALERQIEKEKDRLSRTRVVTCSICGKAFTTLRRRQECCSAECSRKSANQKASHRKDARISAEKKIDRDITVKKLYTRDNGICWICGNKCDLNDYEEINGTIICGNSYPSIDHIVPVCKGGSDSWDNVRLAHRLCNTQRYWQENTPPTERICALCL